MSEETRVAPGGFGGLLDRPHHARSGPELNLIRRALREGWPVSSGVMQKIMDRVELIVDVETDDAMFIKAAQIAIHADKNNIAAARNEKDEGDKGSGDVNIQIVEININTRADVDVAERQWQEMLVEGEHGDNGKLNGKPHASS
jgi:hypothetical protein